jgi:transposase
MGRSRGGLTTKIHALGDAEGLSIALKLTEGQAHDGRSGRDMLDALVEGQTLLADRAYDSDELRRSLDERGAWANIKPNRKNVPALQKPGRAFLQQNQILPRRGHAIRQNARKLPRRSKARFTQNLDALNESIT